MALPPDTLDVSLNEVEGLALKAARGSGLPWGVAEDVGRAAAWMARHAGTWATSLLDLLETPPSPEQNPLLLAGFLADSVAGREPRTADRVVAPAWVLPGLLSARGENRTIRLGEVEIRCGADGSASATCATAALADLPAGRVELWFAEMAPPPLPRHLQARFSRSVVAVKDWRRLDVLAQRTYVPASDVSRLTGAGATRLDDE